MKRPRDGLSINPKLLNRFRYSSDVEFICIDTSKEPAVFNKRLFRSSKTSGIFELGFAHCNCGARTPTWRIPFCHHPPFCAGPAHHNTKGMSEIVKRFEKAGVRVVLSGHEHQFQHSRANDIDYLVTGGAGQLRTKTPDKFAEARTVSWAANVSFPVGYRGRKAHDCSSHRTVKQRR